MIVTPVLGSILGELFFSGYEKIKNNGGRLAGSKKIGKVAMVLLNPAGALSDQINKVLGKKVIKDAKANFVVARRRNESSYTPHTTSNYVGVYLNFKFN